MIDSQSPSSHPELKELTRRALKHLSSLGYGPKSLGYFELTWQRLLAFAQVLGSEPDDGNNVRIERAA
jgi:hypothetical protein